MTIEIVLKGGAKVHQVMDFDNAVHVIRGFHSYLEGRDERRRIFARLLKNDEVEYPVSVLDYSDCSLIHILNDGKNSVS